MWALPGVPVLECNPMQVRLYVYGTPIVPITIASPAAPIYVCKPMLKQYADKPHPFKYRICGIPGGTQVYMCMLLESICAYTRVYTSKCRFSYHVYEVLLQ